MAKIISVELLSVPDEINVSDNETDITVVTTIQFHKMDLQHKMEYCLHLFVYDIQGKIDPPLIIANWDESYILPIETSLDRQDDFLGKVKVLINADKNEMSIRTPMALKLGKLIKDRTYFTRKLEVFATAAPAMGRISKWSQPYETQVIQ